MKRDDPGYFILPSGREISLTRMLFKCAEPAPQEDSPAALLPDLLKSLPENAKSWMPPGEPLAVIQPEEGMLLRYQWIAEFEVKKEAKKGEPELNSRFYLCGFTDAISPDLLVSIEAWLTEC